MTDESESQDVRLRGLSRFRSGELLQSVEDFDLWLDEHPDDRDILNCRARALEKLGRFEEALQCIDRSIARQPQDAAELLNRALILTRLSRLEEALTMLEEVLLLTPKAVDVLIKRAFLLHQSGRRQEALASADTAVESEPHNLSALNLRGMILDDLGRDAEARVDFDVILELDPNHAEAMTNRAICHAKAGGFREALTLYDSSLAIKSEQPNAFYNRAVVRLVLGDWRQGFQDFESRWALFPHEAKRLSRLGPRWNGDEDIAGKTILLHHEQGYGDTLQFCRYATLVKGRGANVHLAVPNALRRLMAVSLGSVNVVSEGEPTPPHDFHCPLMSLPRALGTTPNTVPRNLPYLRAEPALVKKWAKYLGGRRRPRIGIVWSGRRYFPVNHARDMTLSMIEPLLRGHADFYCLQPEMSEVEQLRLSSLPGLHWPGRQFEDFADTAGLIMNLDLVITVDSAVAHLTGALGKPVWLMNRYATCWRWLLDRADTPWYASMRIYRQQARDDWVTVVQSVAAALSIFLDKFNIPRSNGDDDLTSREIVIADHQSHLQSGLDHHNAGRLDAAIAQYRGIVDISPTDAQALHLLGTALAQCGRYAEALASLEQAVNLRLDNPMMHTHYGNALAGLKRWDSAIRSYDRALECDPGFADAHYNRGIALAAMGLNDAALLAHERAVHCNPRHVQALNNRAILLMDRELWESARQCLDRALAIQPTFMDARINRAHLLRRINRPVEALADASLAVDASPAHAEAHNCRGAVLAALGLDSDALDAYSRALQLNPDFPEATWNTGLIKLAQGDFVTGWRCYEARWRVRSLKLVRRFLDGRQLCPGDSVNGKTVLLHSEQGYGDAIQFARYAALLATLGARVIVSVPSALVALFEGQPGIEEVILSEVSPGFDYHCPMLSLPFTFGTQLNSIPGTGPYLHADTRWASRWATALVSRTAAPRIGIVWSGRRTHQNDRNRSMSLKEFRPLLRYSAHWVSLQKEIRETDADDYADLSNVQRCGERLDDFADTAGLITQLDLVITVDTAIAHLAGALGKSVWILLPYVSDWRWLRDRHDSPWYPTARLFRQSGTNQWAPLVQQVQDALEDHEWGDCRSSVIHGNLSRHSQSTSDRS